MTTYADVMACLEACATAAELQRYATDLYNSGLIDKFGQLTTIGHRAPLAPWSLPVGAEIIQDDGGSFTAQLANGNFVGWDNTRCCWYEPRLQSKQIPQGTGPDSV